MALDTLANVKQRLGVTSSADDSLFGQLQAAGDAWVANHCQRDFAGGSFTEYFPGGSAFAHLRNYPVSSVTSVKVDAAYGFGSETALATTAYVTHTERGVIQALNGPFLPSLPRVVQVVYATATSAVPDDVKTAYALLIGHWYRMVKTDVATGFQHLTQQKAGDLFATYLPHDPNVPPEIPALLAPYRTPTV